MQVEFVPTPAKTNFFFQIFREEVIHNFTLRLSADDAVLYLRTEV